MPPTDDRVLHNVYYVASVTNLISEKYGFEKKQALRECLFSETYRMLCNPRLVLEQFCPEIISELWEAEIITGNPRNSVYIRGA